MDKREGYPRGTRQKVYTTFKIIIKEARRKAGSLIPIQIEEPAR